MKQIALYGPRGAGKSTTGRLIVEFLGDTQCKIVHSATPLYEIQDWIYRTANVPLMPGTQDGNLLARVAGEIRRLNPDALADYVIRHLDDCQSSAAPPRLFVCDDSVVRDREKLATRAFRFLYVTAPPQIRRERRERRRDIDPAADANDPEVEKVSADDLELLNSGSFGQLRRQVHSLLAEVLP